MKNNNITIRISEETRENLIELKNFIESEVKIPVSLSSIIRLATEQYVNRELYNYRKKNENI